MNPFPPVAALFQHKRGSSFVANCQYKVSGVAAPMPVGMTVASQVRNLAGKLVASLTYTPGSAGAFTLHDNTTADWPLGYLFWDIKYTLGAVVTHSETIAFELVRGETA